MGKRYRRVLQLFSALVLMVAAPGVATAAGSAARTTGIVFGSSIAAARNVDGRLEFFGTNSGDAVFHRYETKGATGDWSPWAQFDGALRP
ncbi:hypothetical protein ABZ502_11360 [Streptomyces abikoensis]|uniref:hypothetical protein n=1 Tax=Streptomyces abikoensis TaxID=97398 RepID=UPI00340647B1